MSKVKKLYEAGEFEKAIKALQPILRERPDDAEVWQILGTCQYELKRLNDARKSLETAWSLAPVNPRMAASLARCLNALALPAETLKVLAQVPPPLPVPVMVQGLFAAEMLQDPTEVRRWLKMKPPTTASERERDQWQLVGAKAVALLGAPGESILFWLGPLNTERLLSYGGKDGRWLRGYAAWLANLGAYRMQRPLPAPDASLPVLILIGDSHVLTYTGQTVGIDGTPGVLRGYVAQGGMARHFQETGRTNAKLDVARVLGTLPEGALVGFCMGEIDCRPEHGVWSAARKQWADAGNMAAKLAADYVAGLAELCAVRKQSGWLVNVPAPKIAETHGLTAEELADYARTVNVFNTALGEAAAKLGWPVADVYGLTVGPDGLSNGQWHLDGNHLSPGVLQALGLAG